MIFLGHGNQTYHLRTFIIKKIEEYIDFMYMLIVKADIKLNKHIMKVFNFLLLYEIIEHIYIIINI